MEGKETGEHPVRDRSHIGERTPLYRAYGDEKLREVSMDVGYEIGREVLGLDNDDAKTHAALYADHAMTLFNPENREALEKSAKMTKEEREALPDDELGRTPAEKLLINFILEMRRQGKIHLPKEKE